jgi:hypothetical protein
MAANDNDQGSAAGVGGTNKVVPLGTGPQSTNEWLGMDSRYTGGTTGSRPDSAARYGGGVDKGQFFKGDSVAPISKEMNSGANEGNSENTGQYGPGGAEWLKGTYGSRENMPKYGGESNKGKLVGAGAGATKSTSGADQVQKDLPRESGVDLLQGTAKPEKQLRNAQKGIGKPGPMGARM